MSFLKSGKLPWTSPEIEPSATRGKSTYINSNRGKHPPTEGDLFLGELRRCQGAGVRGLPLKHIMAKHIMETYQRNTSWKHINETHHGGLPSTHIKAPTGSCFHESRASSCSCLLRSNPGVGRFLRSTLWRNQEMESSTKVCLWVHLRQRIVIARLKETLNQNCVLKALERCMQLVVGALSARNARTVLRRGQVQVGRML